MSSFLDSLGNAARSAACTVLGSSEYINDTLQRLGAFPFDAARRAIPNFWRNALCDTPAPEAQPPPFTGGQCAFSYNIRTRAKFTQNSTGDDFDSTTSFATPVLGPISQTKRRVGVNEVLFAIAGDGEEIALRSVNAETNTIDILTILDVTPTNGQPDVCGDPPPDYPPVSPPDVTVPRDVPYTQSDGTDITIPVVFVFARAQLDIDANITIPFTVNLNGELNVTGNLNLDGTVNFNFGSALGGGQPKDPRKDGCKDVAIPTETPPEDPTEADQPDEPERERERLLIGVLVTVTSLQNERASLIVQDDNPDIYVPSLGHVNFLCRVGTTQGGWTTDIQVKNRRHLIQCPWDGGAVAVRGTPQPGVTWTLTPIYSYQGQPVEYVQ